MHYVLVCVAVVAMFALVAGCADLGSLAGGKTPPRAKHADVSVAEFTPEEPREVKPRCECSRIDKPIVVDGDLSEWEKIPAIVLDKAEFAKNDGGKWAGPQDCSGSMRMGYDSQWLYLAFDVTDDVFNQPFTGGEIWAGDCVQFAFDPLEERVDFDDPTAEVVVGPLT